jgi:hypothetical protein
VNVDIISEYQFNRTAKNTHSPISATTTKVTTLNSSSVIYSLTIITSKKNEFFFYNYTPSATTITINDDLFSSINYV